eukprot:979491-Pleurochrysis_carterae.AAC.1
MFAFGAMEANLESMSGSAVGFNFPGKTPITRCNGPEAIRRNAPWRTTLRCASARAKKSRRHPSNRGCNNGTGGYASCTARISGAREQVETGVKGGACAGLLQPHSSPLGYRYEIQSRSQTQEAAGLALLADVPVNVRRRAEVQEAQGRARKAARQVRRGRARA